MKDVVYNLAHGVETLQWVTTLVVHIGLVVSTVTVTSTTTQYQLVLHLLEL
jgi:hypothetical protein